MICAGRVSNCIKYQFRHNIVPYNKADQYISNIGQPNLYSTSYYEKQKLMSDDEILLFNSKSLIEIKNNSITSGKHRAFAMIGRIISGKEYIPFRSIEII